MTKVLVEPRRPIDNWQQKLDMWTADVQTVINQAKAWAEKRGWSTIQDQKIITEEIIGTYEVPRLLIHTPMGRLLLEPVARSIIGAEGRFDFCVIPSYDSVMLVKTNGTWTFFSNTQKNLEQSWSEESFEKVAHELLKLQ